MRRFFAATPLARGLVVLALAITACGNNVDSGECNDAATAQAVAEQAWASVIEAHNAAHIDSTDEHPELEGALLSSRVDVIVASEEPRRACGSSA
ncbi:MAG: hypothetical protein F4Z58_13410 [Acidimicrobiaceae bacterium]|nr:hypothetical protein [Acidimicrobiaceae bacterium]MYD05672.1 hypothetical protein [Acidimicrobiaceae bacterium]MYI57697.1 hypothetical protein [Acidimicrobiaceae bacterium]